MDIAERLKRLMLAMSVSSSQFADACEIPRPTLSQILTGRNRKISNEIFEKIHVAFPNVNLLWLMFGEGDLFTSEKSINETQVELPSKNLDDSIDLDNISDNMVDSAFLKESTTPSAHGGDSEVNDLFSKKHFVDSESVDSGSIAEHQFSGTSIGNTKQLRKIDSIIILYDDNSYEIFNPKR